MRIRPSVNWIIQTIVIPIRITARVTDGIGRGLARGVRVVIAEPESYEVQIAVVQAACEAEGNFEVGIALMTSPETRTTQNNKIYMFQLMTHIN